MLSCNNGKRVTESAMAESSVRLRHTRPDRAFGCMSGGRALANIVERYRCTGGNGPSGGSDHLEHGNVPLYHPDQLRPEPARQNPKKHPHLSNLPNLQWPA